MLHLITGRIGSGKTEKTYSLLRDFIKNGEEAFIVVPEQYSFETERNLLFRLGAVDADKAPVYSFTFLSEFLLKRAGISYKSAIDDSERAMIMSLALEEISDKLELYSKTGYSAGFINELLGMIKEFRQCGISPESLSDVELSKSDIVLKNKIKELAMISNAYTALIEQSYLDSETALDILHENIDKIDFFRNKIVFIDGFRGFTAQELTVIEDILKAAKDVYITVCTDKVTGLNERTGVFSHTRRTASKLYRINDKVLKTPVDLIRTQNDGYYGSEELAHLEKNFYSPSPVRFKSRPENIEVCSAENFYAECDYVACRIKKLISEDGYRCRDIAVISRDSSQYERQIKAALKKYGVPVYIDKRQPVVNQPLISFVFAALKTAEYGFENESVFRILKTGLTDLKEEEIAALENYTNLWRTSGSRWCSDFTGHPKGFGNSMTENDAETLSRLNKSRKYVSVPLSEFRNTLKDTDGKGAARAVFKLLCDFHADENLRAFAQNLMDNNEFDLAEDQNRVWDILMRILDSIASALGERKVSAKRFSELFRVMASGYSMGSLPKGLDEVTVGSADRVRINAPRAVFVVGVCDGAFPFVQKNKKILSRSEREKLRGFGIELSQNAEEEVMEERFISYNTFCGAEEKLFVSYPRKSVSGADCAPSELVEQVKRIFPLVSEIDTVEIETAEFVRSKESAFQKYAENYFADDETSAVLKKYFESDGEYRGKVSALKRAVKKEPFRIEDGEIARKLFKENMYISATRAEAYYSCPFNYFCRYGIKAEPLKSAELDSLQKGTIIHFVLETLIKNCGSEALCKMSEEELKKLVEEILREYFEEKIGVQGDVNERFVYIYNNLGKKIFSAVKRLIDEFKVSEFVPVDFELKIDNDGKIQPIEIRLKNGTLKIKGSVDRVDMMKTEDKSFVRVIDYKSGKKVFDLSDVFCGINMQMLIYLFSIWKNGTDEYENITPAGVLYMPIGSAVGNFDRNASDEEILAAQRKNYKMSGIVLDDSRVIEGMDSSKSGLIIPVTYKDDKFKGSLIDFSLLQKLYDKVEDNLKNMGNSLHEGRIEAVPIESKCDYCDYKSVCGFENGDEIREIPKFKPDECLEILKGGESDA